MCGFALGGGGTFEPSRKKMKYSPQAVKVKSGSIYSVKTSRKDDRCFVATDGTLWFCSVENCQLARSAQHNSTRLNNFTCTQVDQVKSNYQQVSPVAVLSPNLDKFVASESLKDSIKKLTKNATSCAIEQYCHFLCTGKDCRGFAGKGKQLKSVNQFK